MKAKSLKALLSFLLVLTFAYISIVQWQPPKPIPESALPNEFSSGRAMKHLRFIAREPHPIGSDFHLKVRDYIFNELITLGLNPEIQKMAFGQERPRTIYNIVARIKGTYNSKAILFMAHYDSVPSSPGASDDGAAVVALLETARILKSSRPLKNDVIFLFSDGEERGMLGSRAFIKEHPWLNDIGLVFNFEARGSRGSVIMFETSDENGWIIRELAKAAPYVFTNSIMYEIYKTMPLTGDFTKFKEAGFTGLNFAYIDGAQVFHRSSDSLETISEKSVQNHGKIALSLAKHFGELDISLTKRKDLIYFNFLRFWLIYYPYSWAIPLAIIVLFVFICVVVFGLRRKILTLSGVAHGIFILLLSYLCVLVFVLLAWSLFHIIYPGKEWILKYNDRLFLVSFAAFALAVNTWIYTLYKKKIRILDFAVAGTIPWLILAISSGLFFQAASFQFVWPVLFSLLALGFSIMSKDLNTSSIKTFIFHSTCSFPIIILTIPILRLMYAGLMMNRLSTAIVMVMTTLLFSLLIPLFSFMKYPKSWLLPSILTLAGVIFFILGTLTAINYVDSPRPPYFVLIPFFGE